MLLRRPAPRLVPRILAGFVAGGLLMSAGCASGEGPTTRPAAAADAPGAVSIERATAGLGLSFGPMKPVKGKRHEMKSDALRTTVTLEGSPADVRRVTTSSAIEERALWSTAHGDAREVARRIAGNLDPAWRGPAEQAWLDESLEQAVYNAGQPEGEAERKAGGLTVKVRGAGNMQERVEIICEMRRQ